MDVRSTNAYGGSVPRQYDGYAESLTFESPRLPSNPTLLLLCIMQRSQNNRGGHVLRVDLDFELVDPVPALPTTVFAVLIG